MKNGLFIVLMLFCFHAHSACRIGGDGKNSDSTTLNATFDLSNKLLTVSQSHILAFTRDFNCLLSSDKMYLTDNIGGNVYSLASTNNVRFTIKGTSPHFPLSVGSGDKSASILNKAITLTFAYVDTGAAAVKTFGNNSFTLDNAFTVTSQQCFKIFGFCLWGSDASLFTVNLNVTVINKKSTCDFASPTYEINLEGVTVKELIDGGNTPRGSTTIQLKCDGINQVASNPVNVRLSAGDWDAQGKLLLNSLAGGSKNVGFKLFRIKDDNSALVRLKQGDDIVSVDKNMPLTSDLSVMLLAEYALINNERPTPGQVSSRVILQMVYP